MIRILDTGLVYRNPKPHLRSVHAWHPSLVRLDDGTLLAAFDLGEAVESLDYRTCLSRSADGGRTWSDPVRFFEDPAPGRTTHSVRIGRPGGSLVGFGGRYHRNDPEEGLVNRANLGYVSMDLILLRSADGGRTWSPPETLVPPLVGPAFEVCHAVLGLTDGRWLAPTSTWKGWNGEAPDGMKAVALVSHDEGRTWPEHLDIMDRYADGIICWEQSLVELPDGRLLAAVWAFNERTGRSEPTPYTISENRKTFSPPRPTGLNGQTAKLTALPDGRVLCLYRRDDRPGLWANLSRMDGERWVNLAEAPVWQGAGSGMRGQRTSGDELGGLKFGYPSTVLLENGEVLAVFWCAEDCVHGIRWVRLQIG